MKHIHQLLFKVLEYFAALNVVYLIATFVFGTAKCNTWYYRVKNPYLDIELDNSGAM